MVKATGIIKLIVSKEKAFTAIECDFYQPTKEWANHPFPRRFATEGYVLYHGTSSTQEQSIEENGLIPTASRFDKVDLQQLVEIFDSMDWVGPMRSYGVLKTYSLGHDHADPRGKPTYLATGAKRSLLYASSEFAGGEIARAVRYAFLDLRSYLSDSSVRDDHMNYLKREREYLKMQNAMLIPSLPEYSPESLGKKIQQLAAMEEVAVDAKTNFTHGVVYAVQIEKNDLPFIDNKPSMGTKCFKPLSPNRLIAKIRVPESYVHDSLTKSLDIFDLPTREGVIKDLMSRST